MALGPVRYCWWCYAPQDRAETGDLPCPQCGRPPTEPAGTSFTDKLLWALQHPLVERRVIAAGTLGKHAEPRALQPLRVMARDPDPYLAAAAINALAHYRFRDVGRTLLAVARAGPAPARRAARRALAGWPRAGEQRN